MEWMVEQESNGWNKDTDKSDSSTGDESISSAGPVPLETTVKQNPRIRLSYNRIEVFINNARKERRSNNWETQAGGRYTQWE